MIRSLPATATAATLLLLLSFAGMAVGQQSATAPQNGAQRTIAEVLATEPRFSLLAHTINQAGLRDTLDGEGPLTVFAPVNAAFDEVSAEEFDPYMMDMNKLFRLLAHHVVAGVVPSPANPDQRRIELGTLAEDTLVVDFGKNPVEVGDARVSDEGIKARNGTIYPIDRLLLN